jgi:hypothetical protein
MTRQTVTLYNAQQGHKELMRLWVWCKAMLMAEHRLTVEARPEKRSEQENRLLHSLLGHIAATKEWAGSKHDAETWKRLLTAAWCRAHGEQIKILPALDGCGVDIVFRRTSELTRSECADLIEFVFSWGAMNDVRFPPDPRAMS